MIPANAFVLCCFHTPTFMKRPSKLWFFDSSPGLRNGQTIILLPCGMHSMKAGTKASEHLFQGAWNKWDGNKLNTYRDRKSEHLLLMHSWIRAFLYAYRMNTICKSEAKNIKQRIAQAKVKLLWFFSINLAFETYSLDSEGLLVMSIDMSSILFIRLLHFPPDADFIISLCASTVT